MAFEKDHSLHVNALNVLREHLDKVNSYFPPTSETLKRNKRIAVCDTIRELKITHGVKVHPKDGIYLWNLSLQPIKDPKHPSYQAHDNKIRQHLNDVQRYEKARRFLRNDLEWWLNTSDDTRRKVRKWLNSDRSSDDVDEQNVIHFASRRLAS